MGFLDNIMEFLWSFLNHEVESVWSFKILTQNFGTTMWSFHGVSLPDSGVFLFNFNPIRTGLFENVLSLRGYFPPVLKKFDSDNLGQ